MLGSGQGARHCVCTRMHTHTDHVCMSVQRSECAGSLWLVTSTQLTLGFSPLTSEH